VPSTAKGLRYPAGSDAPNVPQYIQNLATDVDGELFVNGGTLGSLAGSGPPAGQPLIIKTYRATVTSNASGDATITLPGGAFPNGLLSVNLQVNSGNPFVWVVTGATLSTVTCRAYNVSSGSAIGATFTTCLTAIGW
jgi:hypothetical protein